MESREMLLRIESKKIKPVKESVKITVPNRLHMFTYRAAFNIDGKTGGAGISLKSGQIMEVKLSDTPDDGENLISEYICKIFQRLFGYEGFFQVNYVNKLKEHIGLGTTISQTAALCWAINYLFGSPLTDTELRKLIMDEYQENNAGSLIRGLDTGVGVVCSMYGGVNFVTNSRSYVHMEPSEDLEVITFIPDEEHFQKRIMLEEETGQKEISFQADEKSFGRRSRLIYDKFIPSSLSENWVILGRTMAEMHTMGVKKLECKRFNYEFEIKMIDMLLEEGVYLAGLSSLGPMNYIVVRKDETDRIKMFLNKSHIASHSQIFEICKKGIEIIDDDYF